MRQIALALVAVWGLTGVAWGQVLATCGASAGHSYFPPGPLVSGNDIGWAEDQISDGGIILLQDGDSFDIVYTDTIGSRSAKADGFDVLGLPTATGIVIIIASSNATETYHFDMAIKKVMWTQIKYNGVMNKAAAFVSDCQ